MFLYKQKQRIGSHAAGCQHLCTTRAGLTPGLLRSWLVVAAIPGGSPESVPDLNGVAMNKKTPVWLLVIPVSFFLTVIFGLLLLGANHPYVPDTSGDDSCYGAATGSQKEYVRAVIGVAKSMGVNEDGQIVSVMVMLQESGIKNYANDGANVHGYDGFPAPGATFWLNMAKLSMRMPHDAVGHDADSVGLFQQRAS